MTARGTSRDPVLPPYITWGDPQTDPAAALGQLHFDACLSETHTREALVTEHAVEQGANIADHVRPALDRVSLTVRVTNTPIDSPDAQVLPMTLDLPQPDGDLGTAPVFPYTAQVPQPSPDGPLAFLAGGAPGLVERAGKALGIFGGLPKELTLKGVSPSPTPSKVTVGVLQFVGDVDYVQNAYRTLTRLRNTATLLSVVTPREVYSNMVLQKIEMLRNPQIGSSAAEFHLDFQQIRIVSSVIVDAPLPTIPRAVPPTDKGKKDPEPAKEQDIRSLTARAEDNNVSGLNLPKVLAPGVTP